MPLSSLALGFARLATGIGLERKRAEAARRIYQAAVSEPFYVAGTGRICTDLMTHLDGRGAGEDRGGGRLLRGARRASGSALR